MSVLRALWPLIVVVLGSAAQATDAPLEPNTTTVQRESIAAQRATIESTFLTAQQACASRFAVSDCLTEVRREKRAVMDALRRREQQVNDSDRQVKASAALERLQSNTSEEQQRAQALQRRQALQASHERQLRSDEKAAEAAARTSGAGLVQTKPRKPPDTATDTLNQQRFDEKQIEALKRKADKAETLKKTTLAKPLPAPESQ